MTARRWKAADLDWIWTDKRPVVALRRHLPLSGFSEAIADIDIAKDVPAMARSLAAFVGGEAVVGVLSTQLLLMTKLTNLGQFNWLSQDGLCAGVGGPGRGGVGSRQQH